MKNRIVAYLVFLSFFVSCTDKNEIENGKPAYDGVLAVMPTLVVGNDDDKLYTRSGVDWVPDDGYAQDGSKGSYVFCWEANDQFTVFGSSPTSNETMTYGLRDDVDGSNARFHCENFSLESGSVYYAVSPYYVEKREGLGPVKTDLLMSYENQTQIGNNSTAHLGQYDYMASAAACDDGTAKFKFTRLGHFVRIRVGNIPQGTKLKKFELFTSDNDDFYYNQYLDITDEGNSLQNYSPKYSRKDNSTKKFELLLDSQDGRGYFEAPNPASEYIVLHLLLPATSEYKNKQLYGALVVKEDLEDGNDDNNTRYYVALPGYDFKPGELSKYGKNASTSDKLNVNIKVFKEWQHGDAVTRAASQGDPGNSENLVAPDHLYLYVFKNDKFLKKLTLDKDNSDGCYEDWADWTESDKEWSYKKNIAIDLESGAVTSGVRVYLVASYGALDITTGSLDKGSTFYTVMNNATFATSDQTVLKNLYSYDYMISKDDTPIIPANLYHTAAKLDVQWNSTAALPVTGVNNTVKVTNVPNTGIKLFQPTSNSTGSQTYSQDLTEGTKYNGRAVFYVPQLSPANYHIWVGDHEYNTVNFTPEVSDHKTSWLKANINVE